MGNISIKPSRRQRSREKKEHQMGRIGYKQGLEPGKITLTVPA